VAALVARRAAPLEGPRLARGYLIAVAAFAALRVVLFIAQFAAGISWPPIAVFLLAGDAGVVLLGGFYGLAAVEAVRGGTGFTDAPDTRSALRLSVALGFALTTIGKTVSLDFMLDFFAQSHYSKGFLFVIMSVEVVGGVVILLPWRGAVIAATAALGVVMFGAIYTHLHNGEPFDYSRDAVVMLFRLAPIAVLYASRRRAALGAALCCAAAVAGSALVRIAPPATDELDAMVGSWQCSGKRADGGALDADLHIDKQLGGRWLVLRHDDHPPGTGHVLAEWRPAPTGWIASVQDDRGGLALLRSPGWQGTSLVWEGHDVDGGAEQRVSYQRLDPVRFEVRHDAREATGWRPVTTLTCIH